MMLSKGRARERLCDFLYGRVAPAQIEEFRRWRQEPTPPAASIANVSIDTYRQKRPRLADAPMKYEAWEAEQLARDQSVYLTLDTNSGLRSTLDFKAHLVGLFVRWDNSLKISDKRIRNVMLQQGPSVRIEGSFIGELVVYANVKTLEIRNSVIGRLLLHQTEANPLRVTSSSILSFGIGGTHATSGDVTFQHVFIPRDDSYGGFDLQAVRTLRANLADQHNLLAAAVLHSVVLAHERRHEQWPSRIVSYIYEIGADFGYSMTRPLFWLFLSLVAITLSAGLMDAIGVGGECHGLHGWQASLCGEDGLHRLWRGFIYAGQSIFNPLGVFGSRNLLVANTPLAAIGLTVLSLIGTLALVLLAIAVRRRFKLDI